MSFRSRLLAYLTRPMVRPWALAAPIVVLLVCLPLLRPLRHPATVSNDETLRLATITALAEHGTLALDAATLALADSSETRWGRYADQPPLLAVMLSVPARVMRKLGWPIEENAALVAFVLTLLGVTLPVAGAAGLFYRMGRLFELPRPWRAGLALAVVFGSGLISYAVVLNPHAPAAVLLLCSAACLIHVSLSKLPKRGIGWVFLAGVCAALAAAIDPPAGLIGVCLFLAVASLRMPVLYRLAALLLFAIGTAGPIALHAYWSAPVTGEIIPGWQHADTLLEIAREAKATPPPPPPEPDLDDIGSGVSRWLVIGGYVQWVFDALGGDHGIFSHFPVMLIGILGIAAVMHRHWPRFVKALAAATAAGSIAVIVLFATVKTDWSEAMFATRWFIVFLPLLLFWSGAWLRRKHSPSMWVLAGVLLVFSSAVSVIGMTEPYPVEGFDRYTARQALKRLLNNASRETIPDRATPVARVLE